MSDATDLAALVTESAVRRLLALYSRHADALDGAALASIFAPDGQLTAGSTTLDGRDAIRNWIAGMPSVPGAGRHIVSNVVIDCGSDSASAFADMIFVKRGAAGESPAIIVSGSYEDTFVRLPTGWVFASRKISFG